LNLNLSSQNGISFACIKLIIELTTTSYKQQNITSFKSITILATGKPLIKF
jgi:hypothetical protein